MGYFDSRYPDGFIEPIYSDNERYYFSYYNKLMYSTINSSECLRLYNDGKDNIYNNPYIWGKNLIGKILYNAIESIDLPIIKPIKFI